MLYFFQQLTFYLTFRKSSSFFLPCFQLHFLCDPSISTGDQIVTSAIEAAKLRHIAVSKELTQEIKKGQKLNELNLVVSYTIICVR